MNGNQGPHREGGKGHVLLSTSHPNRPPAPPGRPFPALTTQRKMCAGGLSSSEAQNKGGGPDHHPTKQAPPKKETEERVLVANEALRGEGAPSERRLMKSRKLRCCGAVPRNLFPQSSPLGSPLRAARCLLLPRRRAEGRRSRGLALCWLQFRNSTSSVQSFHSLYDQYVFVSKHRFASAFS